MALNDKTRKHNDMDFQKDLSEILTNAKIGLWAIEMDEGKEPRMYFDDVAREITGFYEDMTPEECYERWYKRIVDSAIDSVQASVKEMKEDDAFVAAPKWLDRDKNTLQGKVVAIPTKEDIDFEIAEHLIVELYSK